MQETGSILGLGSSPGEGNGTLLQYSCLGNPWTEEPGGLQSRGHKRVGHDLATKPSPPLYIYYAYILAIAIGFLHL